MDIVRIKNKIRKLKKLEVEIRFGKDNYDNQPLFWNEFFDLNEERKVKYPLAYLLLIDNDEYRKIANEFLVFVYSDLFEHLDVHGGCCFDKAMLIKLSLPYDADIAAVKKRFRELAKQYHPDKGGDSQKFIELMEIYRELERDVKK